MKTFASLFFLVAFASITFAQHFSLTPENGCGSAEVSFTNLHPSGDYTPEMFITTGFSYEWDFGNGNTSTLENPEPELFDGPGQYEVNYSVTIDTIGFELSKIVLDGYLGCSDPFGGDVDVYIIVTDNNGLELVNTEDDADSYQVDPEESNYLEFNLGSMNVGSEVPLWLKIMDSDSFDADDNCIDGGEGDGTMIAIQLPPNNEDGFFETTKVIEASTLNGDLTITAHFNKPVLMLSQSITVDVFPIPAPPTISNQDINLCVGSEMPEITASGDNIEWYDDADLSNLIHSGNSFIPTLSVEDSVYTFYATQTDNINNCKSEAALVTIDYGTMASPTFMAYNENYCYGQIMPHFVAEGENLTWYHDAALENEINNGDTLAIDDFPVGNHTFYCTQSNAEQTCVSDAAVLSFSVNDAVQANVTSNDVSCYGGSDGSASVEVTAGNEPFEFLWSDGTTSQSLSNAPAGEYTVTIRDADFCLAVVDARIDSPDSIVISPNVTQGMCPDDEFGSISINVSGGVAPYTYLWSDGSDGDFADELTESNYSLTVTDANSCQMSEDIVIEKGEAFVIEKNIIPAACPDVYDGSIQISVSGATEPYEFYWSNGASDTIVSELQAKAYDVTITDFYGCTYSEQIELETKYEYCLVPATVFTPNSDGKNDTWTVLFIELYPQAEVFVYSKTGKQVFQASGYQSDWDGTFNGNPLPTGSYMYFIDLKDGSEPMRGYLDIIR